MNRDLVVELRRVYDQDLSTPLPRVLVDRLWPRGISKLEAPWSNWTPWIAPSHELRKWYDHDLSRFSEFRRAYHQELYEMQRWAEFREICGHGHCTLMFATKSMELNHALILREFLIQGINPCKTPPLPQ